MGLMDFAGMMKNLPQMMGKAKEVQEKLKNVRVRGRAGGGMVVVEMNGHGDLLSVKIEPEAVDPDDVEMLQDLIVAAVAAARKGIKQKAQEELGAATGVDLSSLGIDLPGLE